MQNSSKRYKDDLGVIFDQWPKLHLGFDAEPEIRILEVIYYTHPMVNNFQVIKNPVSSLFLCL